MTDAPRPITEPRKVHVLRFEGIVDETELPSPPLVELDGRVLPGVQVKSVDVSTPGVTDGVDPDPTRILPPEEVLFNLTLSVKARNPQGLVPGHWRERTLWSLQVAPARPTAAARDSAGAPLDRDEYAETLADRADRSRYGETMSIAALLYELAAVYPGERIADVAANLARQLEARAGVE